MIRFKYLVAPVMAGALFVGACSSSSDDVATNKGSANTAGVTMSNTNANTLSNGTQVLPPQPADPNSNPAAAGDAITAPGDALQAKLDKLKSPSDGQVTVDAQTVAKQTARPAPENSTFASFLTDAGYEIRTFKSHPQLLRVEKKISPDGKQTIKVFLKDGRVVDLPGESIHPLSTAASEFILRQAGVQTQAPRPPASGPAPTKKSGE